MLNTNMQGISLLVLLLLVQSCQCTRSLKQNGRIVDDFKTCSNEQLEAFLKEQKPIAGYDGPHLVIKEKLISPLEPDAPSSSLPTIENEQFVEYQRKPRLHCTDNTTNMIVCHACAVELAAGSDSPIIGFAILVDSIGSCQQPTGWFNELDHAQWNCTQCVQAQVFIAMASKIYY